MQAMRSAFEVLENKSNKHLNFTITTADVFDSISKTKPSTSDTDNNKYKDWQSQYTLHWLIFTSFVKNFST